MVSGHLYFQRDSARTGTSHGVQCVSQVQFESTRLHHLKSESVCLRGHGMATKTKTLFLASQTDTFAFQVMELSRYRFRYQMRATHLI